MKKEFPYQIQIILGVIWLFVGIALHSGIELIKRYQEELNNLDTKAALRGESMMLEFQEIGEFNKFSKLIKFLHGVKVVDTKILDSKYVLLVDLKSTRYQRISALS